MCFMKQVPVSMNLETYVQEQVEIGGRIFKCGVGRGRPGRRGLYPEVRDTKGKDKV